MVDRITLILLCTWWNPEDTYRYLIKKLLQESRLQVGDQNEVYGKGSTAMSHLLRNLPSYNTLTNVAAETSGEAPR